MVKILRNVHLSSFRPEMLRQRNVHQRGTFPKRLSGKGVWNQNEAGVFVWKCQLEASQLKFSRMAKILEEISLLEDEFEIELEKGLQFK